MSDQSLNQYDSTPEPKRPAGARVFIGVYFECCGIYARIYRRPEQAMYMGRCPRCLREVRARVGPDGVNARLFRAR